MLTDGIFNTSVANGKFRIAWGTTENISQQKGQEMPNFHRIFNSQGISWLLNTIRNHTNRFLQQEINFFKGYPNDQLSDDKLWNEIIWLSEENLQEPNSCLLRIGANVGYHFITGNWQFNDHIEAVENNRGRIVGRIEKAFKTRKLIFDFNEKDQRRFALPGFVKITLQT